MDVKTIQELNFVNNSLVVIGQGSTIVTTSPFGGSPDGTYESEELLKESVDCTVLGVWNAVNQQWIQQKFDKSAKFTSWQLSDPQMVLFGTENGELKSIDMDKLPRRVHDSSIMVSDLIVDEKRKSITALSGRVLEDGSRYMRGYCPPSLEIAYGTSDGRVVVLVSQPERSEIGVSYKYGLSVAFSFHCHQTPISSLLLGSRYLITLCQQQHVRSFILTRFRGKLSNQPKPISSFQVGPIVNLNETVKDETIGPHLLETPISDAVFIQKCCTKTNELYIRLANTGERLCKIKSVRSESNISTLCLMDCRGGTGRLGSQSKRLLLTGHDSGHIEVWDFEPSIERVVVKDRTRFSGSEGKHVDGVNHGVNGSDGVYSTGGMPGGPRMFDLLRMLDRFDSASLVSD